MVYKCHMLVTHHLHVFSISCKKYPNFFPSRKKYPNFFPYIEKIPNFFPIQYRSSIWRWICRLGVRLRRTFLLFYADLSSRWTMVTCVLVLLLLMNDFTKPNASNVICTWLPVTTSSRMAVVLFLLSSYSDHSFMEYSMSHSLQPDPSATQSTMESIMDIVQ